MFCTALLGGPGLPSLQHGWVASSGLFGSVGIDLRCGATDAGGVPVPCVMDMIIYSSLRVRSTPHTIALHTCYTGGHRRGGGFLACWGRRGFAGCVTPARAAAEAHGGCDSTIADCASSSV